MKKIHYLAIVFLATILLAISMPGISFGQDLPGFPWQTWGNFTEYVAKSDLEGQEDDREFKFTGHIDQGIDLFRLGRRGPIFNLFAGLNGVWTDIEEHWWDRYYSPEAGLGFKFPFSFGQFYLGAKYEYFEYSSEFKPYDNEWRTGIFLSWYAGGDWSGK